MKYLVIVLAILFVTPANARHYRHHHSYHHYYSQHRHYVHYARARHYYYDHQVRTASLSARPNDCYGIAWCGCYLRHKLGMMDRSLNLAANWAHVGHATNAHVGAIIVWRHHVGQITGMTAGGAPIVISGNSGRGGVTNRPLSMRGVIALRDLN